MTATKEIFFFMNPLLNSCECEAPLRLTHRQAWDEREQQLLPNIYSVLASCIREPLWWCGEAQTALNALRWLEMAPVTQDSSLPTTHSSRLKVKTYLMILIMIIFGPLGNVLLGMGMKNLSHGSSSAAGIPSL
ncbi:MAG: hypothetical protein ACRD3Q_08085, partial [Terriglobales bacterium]